MREKITITDNGTVIVPSNVTMNIYEIANLFGIFYQTAKGAIRAIEKSGVAIGDYSDSCVVERLTVYPDYYGLEMIIAVAFWVQSHNAKLFREWMVRKTTSQPYTNAVAMFLTIPKGQMLN